MYKKNTQPAYIRMYHFRFEAAVNKNLVCKTGFAEYKNISLQK